MAARLAVWLSGWLAGWLTGRLALAGILAGCPTWLKDLADRNLGPGWMACLA
jgi:hypothetical protein